MSKFAEVTKTTMAEFGLNEAELRKLCEMTEEEKVWFKYKNHKNLEARNGYGASIRSAGRYTTVSASMEAYYFVEAEKFERYNNHILSGEKSHL